MSLTDDWKAGNLDKVPSYEEFQSLKNRLEEALQDAAYFEMEAYSLKQDNTALKGLLKECKPYISYKIEMTKQVGLTSGDINLLPRINALIGESEE